MPGLDPLQGEAVPPTILIVDDEGAIRETLRRNESVRRSYLGY